MNIILWDRSLEGRLFLEKSTKRVFTVEAVLADKVLLKFNNILFSTARHAFEQTMEPIA